MADESWQRSALRNHVIAEKRSAESSVGEIVGHYRLVELLGSGGMGSVYRAIRIDDQIDMSVAVKLIRAVFYSADVIAEFRAERQILANLQHPNIARVLDGGARPDGLPYLIMEYVDGVSPGDYCRRHNLTINQRLALFRQICSAVHYAHQNMVIHQDLKPANILVTQQGTPKLLDFGIAKILAPVPAVDCGCPAPLGESLAEPMMARMTLRYSSPEQVRGEPVTTASDVYSLGVILYELLTDRSPYGDVNRAPHAIMTAVCEQEPPRPSASTPKLSGNNALRGDLDSIILRALRKSPAERYASVAQFSDDIGRYLEGRPVQARGDAPLYLAAKFVRRNLIMVLGATIVLCSLIGGLVEVALARGRAERRFSELRQLAHSVMFNYADAIDSLPGSTPVRAQMVTDALTYLDNLSKEADTPQLQREIVDAYTRVSNVQGNEYQNNLGDPAGAFATARKAAIAAEKLLREDRTTPALNSAAEAFSTFGDLLFSTGDLAATDHAYQRAISLREEIAEKSPHNTDNSLALVICLKHMGDLYGGYGWANLGKTAESLAYYQESNALAAKLVAQFPGNIDAAKASYKALMSLSSSETTMGMRNDAAKDLSETLRQIDKVRGELPGDTHVDLELANAEGRFGQMLLDDRNPAGAIPHLSHAVDLMRNLLDSDPRNAVYRRREAIMQSQWAAALRGSGRISEALTHNERALNLAHALSHDAPGSVEYSSDVGVIERNFAEGLLAGGDAAAALHHVTQAEIILCKPAPAPADPYTQANCGRALIAAGNSHLALNQPSDAVQAFSEAEKIASTRSQLEPLNAIFRSDWARSQAALAAGLGKIADYPNAHTMYEGALKNWSLLRQTNSLSPEDAYRDEEAAKALTALFVPRR